MDKFAKRLQSRLTAKGYRFNKEQCRQAILATATNPELTTEEEMTNAFNWLTQQDEIETATVEPETSAIEPAPASNGFIDSFTGLAESGETEAIASKKEEEIEQSNPSPQELAVTPSEAPEAHKSNTGGIVPQSSGGSGLIPKTQVQQMVASAFEGQPQEFKDQITEYALQHTFDNVRQVQEFLEQLRGMEFSLLVNTLNDHFARRGSMLTLLEEVIEQQKQKEGESKQNFFDSFNDRLNAFQQEMQSRLSKIGI